jgi:hypothetical protein
VTLAELDNATEDLNGGGPSAPLVVPNISTFPHKALLGYFPYATSQGAAPGSFTGQNCRIGFAPNSGVFDNQNHKILSYVDTEFDMAHGMTVEQSIKAQPAPRFVYWRDRFTRAMPPEGFWSSLDEHDVVGCPLYRDAGESDEDLYDSGIEQIDVAEQHHTTLALVGGLWNRNNTLSKSASP